MTPATNRDLRIALPGLIKWFLILGPVVGGLAHQLAMKFFGIDEMYVFVNPPGHIEPFVSLEWTWWFVLLAGSSLLAIFVYSERLQNIPRRTASPFYLYVLFLLLLVKPV